MVRITPPPSGEGRVHGLLGGKRAVHIVHTPAPVYPGYFLKRIDKAFAACYNLHRPAKVYNGSTVAKGRLLHKRRLATSPAKGVV